MVEAIESKPTLITLIEEYYSLVFEGHPRCDEWKQDKQQKHKNDGPLPAKKKLKTCAFPQLMSSLRFLGRLS